MRTYKYRFRDGALVAFSTRELAEWTKEVDADLLLDPFNGELVVARCEDIEELQPKGEDG